MKGDIIFIVAVMKMEFVVLLEALVIISNKIGHYDRQAEFIKVKLHMIRRRSNFETCVDSSLRFLPKRQRRAVRGIFKVLPIYRVPHIVIRF